jgi:hypothetical protein
MAAVTGCTDLGQMLPNASFKLQVIKSPSTMDSADTIVVSSATATGGATFKTVYGGFAFDATTGDAVTLTWSTTTLTIDAAGGTTDHVYWIIVWGV